MHIHDVESYRPLLEAEIRKHTNDPITLLIVDDIETWDNANEIFDRGNPSAQCVPYKDPPFILIRRCLDQNRTGGIVGRLLWTIGEERLRTPDLFLRHLVLHELAHLLNDWGQDREDDCDRWASDRL